MPVTKDEHVYFTSSTFPDLQEATGYRTTENQMYFPIFSSYQGSYINTVPSHIYRQQIMHPQPQFFYYGNQLQLPIDLYSQRVQHTPYIPQLEVPQQTIHSQTTQVHPRTTPIYPQKKPDIKRKIPERPYISAKGNKKSVAELYLKINGVTKTFDSFMNDYMKEYFPNLDTKTYRVPPIHFNKQSLQKPEMHLHESFNFSNPNSSISSNTITETEQNISSSSKREITNNKNEFYKLKEYIDSDIFMKNPHLSSCGFVQPVLSNSNELKSTTKVSVSEVDNESLCSLSKFKDTSINLENDNISKSQEFQAKSKALKDVDILCPALTKDSRADEGENRVINAFEALGKQFGPMFIICGYQYNNYLNKLRDEMFPYGQKQRPTTAFGQTIRAEHDCLIFHRSYGAIIVCIKSIGDNFDAWNATEAQKISSIAKVLDKAVKQLDREWGMIRHVSSDFGTNFSIHKLIALPNLERADVIKVLECNQKLSEALTQVCGGVEHFLCKDELPSKHNTLWTQSDDELSHRLVSWWEKTRQDRFVGRESMDIDTYRCLIGRYCGLLSTVEVWTITNPRIEVRSVSEAVSVCAERFAKFILLPDQLNALVRQDSRMFLYGPPGSGKTLLLIIKAREWLLQGHTVVIINARAGSHGYPLGYSIERRLRAMMDIEKIDDSKLKLININSLDFRSEEMAGVMPSWCAIIDEVTPIVESVIEHLCNLQLDSIWCAGMYEIDRPVTARGFRSFGMSRVLRCPPSVQCILKSLEPLARDEAPYQHMFLKSSKFQTYNSDFYSDFQTDIDDTEVNENQVKTNTDNNVDGSEAENNTENFNFDKESYDTENINQRLNKFRVSYTESPYLAMLKSQRNFEDNKNLSRLHNFQRMNGIPFAGNRDIEFKTLNDLDSEVVSLNIAQEPKTFNDMENLAKRLQKNYPKRLDYTSERLSRRKVPEMMELCSEVFALPTDGPWPHIIDHGLHAQAGFPCDCVKCAEELSVYFHDLIRPKNCQKTFSNSKHINQTKRLKITELEKNKMNKRHLDNSLPSENKSLKWSDILITTMDLKAKSKFVSQLKKSVPLEIVTNENSHLIETFQTEDEKVYLTSCKEVNGLERALMVYVPSESKASATSANQDNWKTTDLDLNLNKSLDRFTPKDKEILFHIMSRSLAHVVLIVP